MASEGSTEGEPVAGHEPDHDAVTRRRRVRRKVRVRKKETLSRPVQVALWLVIPVVLLVALYLVGLALI